MSSSDSLSARSISCQQQQHISASVFPETKKPLRAADSAEPHRSSTFFSLLLLELLDGLQQAAVVGDAVHSSIFLILFGVHVSQQLNNVNVLFLLWTLLLRWRSESETKEAS